MTALAWLVPAALFLGALGLGAFLWALRVLQPEATPLVAGARAAATDLCRDSVHWRLP